MSTRPDRAPRGTARISVVGVGNILYRDEGVGVYAARYLQHAYRFQPEIEVADGAALGFGLMDFFEDASTVIVLDALLADAGPGTIYRLPTEELLDLGPDITPTAHEVDPIHLLKRAHALGQLPGDGAARDRAGGRVPDGHRVDARRSLMRSRDSWIRRCPSSAPKACAPSGYVRCRSRTSSKGL